MGSVTPAGCRPGSVARRFLGQHETHIAERQGYLSSTVTPRFQGTYPREGAHPLECIVGTLVGQTKDRYQPLLGLGVGSAASKWMSKDTGTWTSTS
jgi:hypothetical protein